MKWKSHRDELKTTSFLLLFLYKTKNDGQYVVFKGEIYAKKDLKKEKIIRFLLVFRGKKSPFPSLFSIKKAQNHWLAPRFFERIFNVRPRVISVTVSNYELKVVKCCKMWCNLFLIIFRLLKSIEPLATLCPNTAPDLKNILYCAIPPTIVRNKGVN